MSIGGPKSLEEGKRGQEEIPNVPENGPQLYEFVHPLIPIGFKVSLGDLDSVAEVGQLENSKNTTIFFKGDKNGALFLKANGTYQDFLIPTACILRFNDATVFDNTVIKPTQNHHD
jgi:hypothetical protein